MSRRLPRAIALLGACLLVAAPLSGCSRATATSSNKPHKSTTTTTTLPPAAPLTGLPTSDPAVLSRPAVMLKIDNELHARPQSGLDKADVVYEEVVEGGDTRYLAVFQSQEADPVGPVRSVRQTDAEVAQPIGGLFGYSGGIPAFVTDIRQTGVVDVSAVSDSDAYHRSADRPSPHNLYTSTPVLRQKAPLGMGPPPRLFAYLAPGAVFDPAGVARATHVVVNMSPASIDTWDWNGVTGRWQRTTNGTAQTVAPSGDPLAFTNVIIQLVPYHDTGFVDTAGAPVPDAEMVGSGACYMLSQGSIANCTWSKANPSEATTFTDVAGKPLRIQPGTTWVMLAQSGTGVLAA